MSDNPLQTIAARDVKVGGLIGRRIELTWQNNLLAVNWDRDFLAPFPDPGGRATYFACADSPLMTDDELFPQGRAESQGK